MVLEEWGVGWVGMDREGSGEDVEREGGGRGRGGDEEDEEA